MGSNGTYRSLKILDASGWFYNYNLRKVCGRALKMMQFNSFHAKVYIPRKCGNAKVNSFHDLCFSIILIKLK